MKYLMVLLVAFNLNGFSEVKAQQIAEYEVESKFEDVYKEGGAIDWEGVSL